MTIAEKKNPKRTKGVFRNVPVINKVLCVIHILTTTTHIQAGLVHILTTATHIQARLVIASLSTLICIDKLRGFLQHNTFDSNLVSYR